LEVNVYFAVFLEIYKIETLLHRSTFKICSFSYHLTNLWLKLSDFARFVEISSTSVIFGWYFYEILLELALLREIRYICRKSAILQTSEHFKKNWDILQKSD